MPCTLKPLSAEKRREILGRYPEAEGTASQRAALASARKRMEAGAVFLTTKETMPRRQLASNRSDGHHRP
jgi:hypothetical protein